MSTPASRLKAYLASPMGFSEVTDHFMRTVYVPRLKAAGVNPINPWDLTTKEEVDAVLGMPISPERLKAIRELHRTIGMRNKTAIVMCPVVIAQLDGQEMDSGTVGEVGWAAGRGKVVYGWRSDFRKNGEEGALCNLQVQFFIEESGGRIFNTLDELCDELKRFQRMFGA
ncbi:MAG TPA: nucleoside 2-deoxyribosyltransferase [Candidatus Obscuribacterales bacterium]